jgi:hypothetical protein
MVRRGRRGRSRRQRRSESSASPAGRQRSPKSSLPGIVGLQTTNSCASARTRSMSPPCHRRSQKAANTRNPHGGAPCQDMHCWIASRVGLGTQKAVRQFFAEATVSLPRPISLVDGLAAGIGCGHSLSQCCTRGNAFHPSPGLGWRFVPTGSLASALESRREKAPCITEGWFVSLP